VTDCHSLIDFRADSVFIPLVLNLSDPVQCLGLYNKPASFSDLCVVRDYEIESPLVVVVYCFILNYVFCVCVFFYLFFRRFHVVIPIAQYF